MHTVRQISTESGVSIGTISRYFNGHRLKSDTVLKIEKAIDRLSGDIHRSLNIGVLVQTINDSFSGNILLEIQKIISNTNHKLIILSNQNLNYNINELNNFQLDGIIIHPEVNCDLEKINILSSHIPTVVLDLKSDKLNCDQVLIDNVNAVYDACELLVKRNHTNFAIAFTGDSVLMGQERLEGYKRILSDYNLPLLEKNIININSSLDVEIFMQNKSEQTALVSTNYFTTIHCLNAFNRMNISIPHEFSFVGFDDFNLSRFYKLRPFFVVQPMDSMAKLSFELLLKRIKGDYSNFPSLHRLKTSITKGNSIKTL